MRFLSLIVFAFTNPAGLWHRLHERYHERRLNIQTSKVIYPQDLGYSDPSCREYAPVTFRSFRAIMRRVRVAPADVFLDLGSGMGRVIVLASDYGFSRVIGIELSEPLNVIARTNCQNACQGKAVEVVTHDAATYAVPDDVTVIFFYNSFHGEVFAACLVNIRKSMERVPRPIRLICLIPRGSTHIQEQVQGAGIFELAEAFDFEGRRCCIYVNAG